MKMTKILMLTALAAVAFMSTSCGSEEENNKNDNTNDTTNTGGDNTGGNNTGDNKAPADPVEVSKFVDGVANQIKNAEGLIITGKSSSESDYKNYDVVDGGFNRYQHTDTDNFIIKISKYNNEYAYYYETYNKYKNISTSANGTSNTYDGEYTDYAYHFGGKTYEYFEKYDIYSEVKNDVDVVFNTLDSLLNDKSSIGLVNEKELLDVIKNSVTPIVDTNNKKIEFDYTGENFVTDIQNIINGYDAKTTTVKVVLDALIKKYNTTGKEITVDSLVNELNVTGKKTISQLYDDINNKVKEICGKDLQGIYDSEIAQLNDEKNKNAVINVLVNDFGYTNEDAQQTIDSLKALKLADLLEQTGMKDKTIIEVALVNNDPTTTVTTDEVIEAINQILNAMLSELNTPYISYEGILGFLEIKYTKQTQGQKVTLAYNDNYELNNISMKFNSEEEYEEPDYNEGIKTGFMNYCYSKTDMEISVEIVKDGFEIKLDSSKIGEVPMSAKYSYYDCPANVKYFYLGETTGNVYVYDEKGELMECFFNSYTIENDELVANVNSVDYMGEYYNSVDSFESTVVKIKFDNVNFTFEVTQLPVLKTQTV